MLKSMNNRSKKHPAVLREDAEVYRIGWEHFFQAEVAHRNRQGSFFLIARNAANRANRLKFVDAGKMTLVPVAWLARAELK